MTRLPGQNQGHAQAGRDVGLSGYVSGLAREPVRGLELLDGLLDITEVSEDYASRLVRDRGLRCRRVPGQQLTRDGEGLRWPR